MLESIKQSLRISADCTDFDDEINDLIEQSKDDLSASGVLPDALNESESGYDFNGNIRRLITLYCKAFFGLENPDKDWYLSQYEKKKAETLNQSLFTIEDEE